MRVGVAVYPQERTVGGGHAYQALVLAELSAVASKHEFIVLLDEATDTHIGSELHAVDLASRYRPAPPVTSVARSVAKALVPRALHGLARAGTRVARTIFRSTTVPVPKEQPRTRRQLLLERAIDDLDLDVIWFLTQEVELVSAPFFTTVWDLQHRRQPWFPEVSTTGWDWDTRERYYSRVLPRAARIFTGTRVGKDEIVRYYGVDPQNVLVIPFVPPSATSTAPLAGGEAVDVAAKYALAAGYLLYPAQFWPHKNHVNLLLALHHLKASTGLEPTLVLVGSDKGNLEHVRGMVTQLRLESQIRILGFVPAADLIALYREAIALVFPTFFGPDNIPPLEAFALGCPVVASQVPGADEQLGDAALLFDPSRPEELAHCIAAVIGTPSLRAGLREKGAARAAETPENAYAHAVIEALDAFEPFRRTWKRGYRQD